MEFKYWFHQQFGYDGNLNTTSNIKTTFRYFGFDYVLVTRICAWTATVFACYYMVFSLSNKTLLSISCGSKEDNIYTTFDLSNSIFQLPHMIKNNHIIHSCIMEEFPVSTLQLDTFIYLFLDLIPIPKLLSLEICQYLFKSLTKNSLTLPPRLPRCDINNLKSIPV